MKARLLVVGLAVGAALALAARVTPTIEYRPQTGAVPSALRDDEPGQAVVGFLRRFGRLPRPGAEILRRNGQLVWSAVGDATPIVGVEVEMVRLAATANLMSTLLDDDPTYTATVEVRVTTADARTVPLTVLLWDYGVLTPWSLRHIGDGWKPMRVSYLSEP